MKRTIRLFTGFAPLPFRTACIQACSSNLTIYDQSLKTKKHVKTALAILSAVALGNSVLPDSIADEVPGLEVKIAVLTSGISEKNYVDPGLPSGIRIKRGPIYLWTVLSGTSDTLAALTGKRSFPVRHKWTYLGRSGERPDTPDEAYQDPEQIKVGTVRRWPGLSYEAWSNGFFDWRTWTGKKHLRRGRYLVEVIFDGGGLLKQNGVECKYYFDYLP